MFLSFTRGVNAASTRIAPDRERTGAVVSAQFALKAAGEIVRRELAAEGVGVHQAESVAGG